MEVDAVIEMFHRPWKILEWDFHITSGTRIQRLTLALLQLLLMEKLRQRKKNMLVMFKNGSVRVYVHVKKNMDSVVKENWLVNWLTNCLCILARLFVTVIRLKKCRMPFGLLSTTRVLPTRNRSITSVYQVLARGASINKQRQRKRWSLSNTITLPCQRKS